MVMIAYYARTYILLSAAQIYTYVPPCEQDTRHGTHPLHMGRMVETDGFKIRTKHDLQLQNWVYLAVGDTLSCN